MVSTWVRAFRRAGFWALGVAVAFPAAGQQGFYREFYAGIDGNAVANLTNAPAFPDAPTVEEVVDNAFETGTNIADAYGTRARALLTPPATGSYTFWIATDDGGELWLGTDASPATRRRIATVNGWTSPRQWTKEANQRSAPIALTAGTPYYIEALHKEGGGGDNLAVAWQVPGDPATNVIPASALRPYLDPPAIRTQPASVDVFEQWAGVQAVTFAVEAVRKGGVSYQWSRNGVDISNATQAAYTLLADTANSNALYRCRLTSLGGAVTSEPAQYRLVPDEVAPALLSQQMYHDPRQLILMFSEPLAADTVQASAFAIAGVPVLEARLLAGGARVLLALGSPLAPGTVYALDLSVADCAVPANPLTLAAVPVVPQALAAAPAALLRPPPEAPGPSSRRTALAVTEIAHTPAPRVDGRDVRFVELYNANPYPQDIGGYRFSGAFEYAVPTGTVVGARAYLAVAPAPADLAAVYGLANVVGGFEAPGFDGTSEITLHDELGAWLTTVAYSDDPPWPVAADGSGHTLVLARPSYGEREVDGWAASAAPGGSPGAAEPARNETYAALLFNEVLAHAGGTNGFVELFNASASDVSLDGCALRRGAPDAGGYLFPPGATVPARGRLAVDEAALGSLINGDGDTLWLLAPEAAGRFVIDALRFDNLELGVAWGRFPDGAGLWSRLETPTPGDANAARRVPEVVLSELMYHPISGDKDDEYVELHNPGTNAVDLTGWRLGGGIEYTFGETLPAGGYLIVPRARNRLAALYPDRVGQMTADGYSSSLDNSRDTVTLARPAPVMSTDDPAAPVVEQKRVVVEEVTYRDGGEWGALADGGGSSLERVDPRADPRLARSWAASDETQKSAWTTLEFTGAIDLGFTASINGSPNEMHLGLMEAGECLVDAVEVRAAGGPNLVNNPSFEADTPDWRFMGTHDGSAIEADAGAYDGGRVLRVRAVDRVQTGMNVVRGALSAALPTSGAGSIRARVRWLSGCPELLIRTRGNWLEASGSILTTRALGSPGQPNSRARTNGAPAIAEVVHRPLLPRNGEAVTVYARVADPDGLSQAVLRYRIEGAAGTNAVAMAPCAGGWLAGVIPAGQPANALAAFWVEVADGHAQTAQARFPADAPRRECLVRYNEPLVDRAFGVYRFWMTKENLAYWATREKASNAPVDATFVYGDDRVLYHAGMFYAGSPFHSNYSTPINAGNIDYEAAFAKDDRLLDDDGLVLSTVGNLGNDTIGVREQFCFSMVHALELPHMHRRYVHLYANGTEQNAKRIFEDTEKPNGSVLDHWFPEAPDGDFFKIDDWFEYTLDLTAFSYITARLQSYRTAAPDGDGQVLKLGRYRWNWLKRASRTFEANDYTNFFGLVETLNTADAATYTRRIQDELDLESFAGVIAMNHFIVNWDTYGYNRGKNMYLYDSARGWSLIAWDLDFNFGDAGAVINPALGNFPCEDPTMRTFLNHPVVSRVYWRAVARLAAAAADPAVLSLTRAKYDALMADGTSLGGSYDDFMSAVAARRVNVAAQLAAADAAAFTVTAPAAGYSESTANVVTLHGAAPFGVTAIRINGAEVPVTWTTPTTWSAQAVLNNGTNAFAVTAHGPDGAVWPGGTVTRVIAYTGVPLDALETHLGISEILAVPATNGAAFVEIENRSATTVMNLTGVYLDGAVRYAFPNGTTLHPGALLTVVEDASAFAAAYGDAAAARVAGAYEGTLPAAGGTLLLRRGAAGYEPDDPVLDRVVYEAAEPWPAPASAGVALQRINPALDNNRVANWAAETTIGQTTQTAVAWSQVWRYTTAGDPGDAWAAEAFDDAAWPAGPGPLGRETDALPIPLATTFNLTGRLAYYFRTTFTYDGDPANATLRLTYMLDDAAAFYLNGQELHRSALMPLGTLTDATPAVAAKTPEGEIEGPFALPAAALRAGVNTLAVRVHQNQAGSSDLVFGMRLEIETALASTASPGAANALNVALPFLPEVWLNEVQTRNATGAADNAGEREPWVELYNSGTQAVALAGWRLATADADPGWAFPAEAAIGAGAYLRVWLDAEPGETADGHLHAGFRFDAADGLLLLRAPVGGRDVVVDYLRVAGSPADGAWGAWPDGTSNPRRWLLPPTPGGANRADRPARRVVVNELMAANDLFVNPLSGKKDDWFELFNDGAEPVDLGGYVVTDTLVSEAPPAPDLRASKALVISNGVVLLPGQALRIWTGASGSASLPYDPANLQAPFGLSKDGDHVCLFSPELALLDRLSFGGGQVGTASVGRWLNGAAGDLVAFGSPTPGQPNRNPRHAAAWLAQPGALTLREQEPFSHTAAFAQPRPANWAFRLFPADGPALPAGLAFDEAAGAVAWTPAEDQGPGLYAFRLCGFLADGPSVTGCDEVLLTLRVLETPSRPILGALTSQTVNEGSRVAFTVAASRAEEVPPYATSTRLRLEGAVPPLAVFDPASGAFEWQTGEADGPGTNVIRVVAEDVADPAVFDSLCVTVTVREVNAPLVYRSPTAFYLWRNEPFAVYLRYEDPDLPPNRFTYSLISGPPGLTLDSASGLLAWQPAPEQTGSFSARFRTFDNAGSALSTTVSLAVDTAQLQAATFGAGAAAGSLDLRWVSKLGTFYTVEWCADLSSPAWQPLNAEAPVAGTGGVVTFPLSPQALGLPPAAFFRIVQTR